MRDRKDGREHRGATRQVWHIQGLPEAADLPRRGVLEPDRHLVGAWWDGAPRPGLERRIRPREALRSHPRGRGLVAQEETFCPVAGREPRVNQQEGAEVLEKYRILVDLAGQDGDAHANLSVAVGSQKTGE